MKTTEKLKQILIKVLKINITPAYTYTINLIDYDNNYHSCRASGRTTRLADMYVQLLFSTGSIRVEDHYDSYRADRCLLEIIVRRLQTEHPGVEIDIRGDAITLNKQKGSGINGSSNFRTRYHDDLDAIKMDLKYREKINKNRDFLRF